MENTAMLTPEMTEYDRGIDAAIGWSNWKYKALQRAPNEAIIPADIRRNFF
jgi:hypothetical protein